MRTKTSAKPNSPPKDETAVPGFTWAVPKELGIPADELRLRVDFYHQSTVMTFFQGDIVETRQVDAMDIVHALARDLSFGTGLLPPGTIFWRNTKNGPFHALYVEPRMWKVALQTDVNQPPRRYNLPMPGLIFLCSPGRAPWVYAAKGKPTKESDDIFNAPLCNIHSNGQSCAGTNKYPTRVADMVQSFFLSFFTASADLTKRSHTYPKNIVQLWAALDGKPTFPLTDLVRFGTVQDLLNMEMY